MSSTLAPTRPVTIASYHAGVGKSVLVTLLHERYGPDLKVDEVPSDAFSIELAEGNTVLLVVDGEVSLGDLSGTHQWLRSLDRQGGLEHLAVVVTGWARGEGMVAVLREEFQHDFGVTVLDLPFDPALDNGTGQVAASTEAFLDALEPILTGSGS